jgi:hypothetical protein
MNSFEIKKQFDLLKSFPKGEELFPFKMYESWDAFYKDINQPYLPKNRFSELSKFQEINRSPAGKAASIIFDKYKRKYNLDISIIEELMLFCAQIKEERELAGKKCTDDFLTQKCSEYIKNKYNKS